MSNLLAARDLSKKPEFIDRVAMAAVEAAVNVSAEPLETANHTNRNNLAVRVLASPRRWGELMAAAVALNGTINAAHAAEEPISDSDISFTVASLWDAYAGSSATEATAPVEE